MNSGIVTSALWKGDLFVYLVTVKNCGFYYHFILNLIIWWLFKKQLENCFARRTICISTGYEFFILSDLNYINTCHKEEWIFFFTYSEFNASERGRKHTEWLEKRFFTAFYIILDFFFLFPVMFVALFITVCK